MSISTWAMAMALANAGSPDGSAVDSTSPALPAQPGNAMPAAPLTPEMAPATDLPASADRVEPVTPSATVPLPSLISAEPEAPAPDAEDDGAIVVTARRRTTKADPLLGINTASFAAIQMVDKAIVAPTAKTYEKVVPKPVRNGLRNFLINLAEPVVFLNFLLQFKPGKAFETAGRFAINSTIGVAGLFDMAKRKPFKLPYRQNGFANTMGYHGVPTGPFLFVPILGPTTIRDLLGRVLDLGIIPAVVGKPFDRPVYGLTTGIVKAMNDRVEFDEQITANRESSDPYVATRDFYLKRRRAEINALHSPEYRARHGIADPVLPPILPHVPDGAAPGSEAAVPTTSIPSSTGMAPAAPAPAEPVSGTPALTPLPATPVPAPAR